MRYYFSFQRIKSSLFPRADWAPAKDEEKREWAKLVLREYLNSEYQKCSFSELKSNFVCFVGGDDKEYDPYHEQFLKLCITET